MTPLSFCHSDNLFSVNVGKQITSASVESDSSGFLAMGMYRCLGNRHRFARTKFNHLDVADLAGLSGFCELFTTKSANSWPDSLWVQTETLGALVYMQARHLISSPSA